MRGQTFSTWVNAQERQRQKIPVPVNLGATQIQHTHHDKYCHAMRGLRKFIADMWTNPAQLIQRMVYPVLGSVGYFHSRFILPVNVVTYHGVRPEGYESPDTFLDGALLSADMFRSQLRLLKKHYTVASPEQFLDWLREQRSLPERAVVLTCDDGLLNHFTDVLPILQEENVRSLFFVTGASLSDPTRMHWYDELYLMLKDARSGSVQLDLQGTAITTGNGLKRSSLWLKLVKALSRFGIAERRTRMDDLAEKLGLSRDWWQRYFANAALRKRFQLMGVPELRKLSEAGMTIGAHTLSHPVLTEQPPDLARAELAQCREALERVVGRPVWALAYPFGDPSSTGTREYSMAQEAGYDCAFVNVGGSPDAIAGRYALPRIHVTAEMSLPVYEASISGIDQALRSRLRRNRNVV